MTLGNFPFYKQLDSMDCGATCIRMIAKHYGREISIQKLRRLSETTRAGSSMHYLSQSAEKIGFRTLGVKLNYETLKKEAPLPCIVHWKGNHFIIVYKIKDDVIYAADPARKLTTYTPEEFVDRWIGVGATREIGEGVALLLEPTPKLLGKEEDDSEEKKGIGFLTQYLTQYKRFIIQLVIGLFAASILQLVFPFLTQSIVDVGIKNDDIHFIYLILIAQLFLILGRVSIEAVRGWILLHLSSRINIALVSDFLIKLMRLPIAYFDVKVTGDILQRINDHRRIENILTTESLNVLFSLMNFIIFGAVLVWYSMTIFWIFLVGTFVYFLWATIFLKKRRELDHSHFEQRSQEQSKVMELISGMQEIKLHNAEQQKRWGWEYIQARLFKIQIKALRLQQMQTIGASLINETKNILISFCAAYLVVEGQITLGMMLSISYIIGQLNSPISQLLNFIFSLQDARISLERLSDIHNYRNEEEDYEETAQELPKSKTIRLKNVHFKYQGALRPVLNGIDLEIPEMKTTAIVGASGSGKSTLMKILLRFYEQSEGEIMVDSTQLSAISHSTWRENCGSVMQEGFIFNDTIARNIAVSEDIIDKERMEKAVTIANIKEFIEELPQSYNTKIGNEGMGISTGQKQRILIARAVYKDPQFIFFDEATSALDTNNEKVIMEQLNAFFKDRTAVVIAHRLSTVRNASQIVVIDEGRIIEKGTHEELIDLKGSYFNLVKNQLQLDKLTK